MWPILQLGAKERMNLQASPARLLETARLNATGATGMGAAHVTENCLLIALQQHSPSCPQAHSYYINILFSIYIIFCYLTAVFSLLLLGTLHPNTFTQNWNLQKKLRSVEDHHLTIMGATWVMFIGGPLESRAEVRTWGTFWHLLASQPAGAALYWPPNSPFWVAGHCTRGYEHQLITGFQDPLSKVTCLLSANTTRLLACT